MTFQHFPVGGSCRGEGTPSVASHSLLVFTVRVRASVFSSNFFTLFNSLSRSVRGQFPLSAHSQHAFFVEILSKLYNQIMG